MSALNETARAEAFSDGVFAVAITLLVLDIKVPPVSVTTHTLATMLGYQWPSYLAFVTSFATILIMWINHHHLFTHIGRANDRLLFSNGLLLFSVTVVPFSTALVAEYLGRPGQRTAAMVYNGTFIAIAIFYNFLWRTVVLKGGLLRGDADHHAVKRITNSYRFGPLFYVAAFALAFVNVTASLTLNLLLAIYFALPRNR